MADRVLSSKTLPDDQETYFDQSKIQRDLLIRRIGKIALLITPLINYFFLWAPIVVLIVFSFNDSRTVASWQGFTTKWYASILGAATGESSFATGEMLEALRASLIVGFAATITSTAIGTMVALSLVRGSFPGKRLLDGVLYLPVVIPEITQGVALLIFFNIIFDYVQSLSGQRWLPGFGTIIIGHVAFNISFVAIVVRARLADMNPRLEEAARDLGANEWHTFWRVTFPLLLPGIVAGALLAFTLSLDDYVVTFFTKGVGTTTLPIFVYGLLKISVTPEINAISTLLLLASTLLVGLSLMLQGSNSASR